MRGHEFVRQYVPALGTSQQALRGVKGYVIAAIGESQLSRVAVFKAVSSDKPVPRQKKATFNQCIHITQAGGRASPESGSVISLFVVTESAQTFW